LQVYRLPMLAWLSILHRGTGVALSFGAILLPAVLVAIAADGASYDCIMQCISAWYGQVVLIGFTFALNYHLCNGIRHLFWDAGYGFDVDKADKTGIASIVVSILLTAGVWAVACLA
jgi:succinate dehydrogenase / fumarate reductase cytochrome b subunit